MDQSSSPSSLEALFDRYLDERRTDNALDELLLSDLCGSNLSLLKELQAKAREELEGRHLFISLLAPHVPIEQLAELYPRFGNIELRRLLGCGGFGCVYEGWQTSVGRKVAVKVFPHEHLKLDSFEREKEILRTLTHADRVPSLYDAGTVGDTGYVYLAMEYIDGLSLEGKLAEAWDNHRFPLPTSDVLTILDGILEGLEQVQARYRELMKQEGRADGASPMVHGDLKPANIILGQGDARKVVIVDFGVAQMVDHRVLGYTQTYASPEMTAPDREWRGPLGPESDVYQVGLIGFALMTGRHYWETPSSDRFRLLKESPHPRYLKVVIRKALAWLPEERFPNATLFRQALQPWWFKLSIEDGLTVGDAVLACKPIEASRCTCCLIRILNALKTKEHVMREHPAYPVPEWQVVPPSPGERINTAAAVFMVGLIGYELLTGKYYWSLWPRIRQFRLKRTRCSLSLRAALCTALETHPKERHLSFNDFESQLRDHHALTQCRRLFNNKRLVAGGIAVGIVVALAGWGSMGRTKPSASPVSPPAHVPSPEPDVSSPQPLADYARLFSMWNDYIKCKESYDRYCLRSGKDAAARPTLAGVYEELSTYRNNLGILPLHRDELDAAVEWLRTVQMGILLRLQIHTLEEGRYLRSATFVIRVLKNGAELHTTEPQNVDVTSEVKDLEIRIDWQPGDVVEVQLVESDSTLAATTTLGGPPDALLDASLFSGGFAAGRKPIEAFVEGKGLKATFSIVPDAPLSAPPTLP